MSFEGKGIQVIGPLDPALGPRYIELVTTEDEGRDIDDVYKLTTAQPDYVNLTDDGMLRWRCESSCAFDSEVGLENWQQQLHKVSGR